MPHPASSRGSQVTEEDPLSHWQRRALSAERDLAELERRLEDRETERANTAKGFEAWVKAYVAGELAKARPLATPRPTAPIYPTAPVYQPPPTYGAYPPPVVDSVAPPMMPRPNPYGTGPMRQPAMSTPDVIAYREDRERERRWKFAGIIALPIIGLVSAVVLALLSHFTTQPALPPPNVRATTAPH